MMEMYIWAPAGFFSRGGQIRGSGLPSPVGSINGTLMGSGAKPPEADKCFENNALNNSSSERFTGITSAPKHFTTFPSRGKCPPSPPLPMLAGAHGNAVVEAARRTLCCLQR